MKKASIYSVFFIISIICLSTSCSNKTKYLEYDSAGCFSEGLAAVGLDGKYGYINTQGVEVIPCKYDSAGCFSEGLAPIKLDYKWGFINTKGEEVIPCKYDFAISFSEGMTAVHEGNYWETGKWGFIDKNGNELSPCKYTLLLNQEFIDFGPVLKEGLAAVRNADTGKWGFVDNTGKEVIPCKYDYVNRFSKGITDVHLNGKQFYIDKTGKEYIKY